jgi:acetyl esterase
MTAPTDEVADLQPDVEKVLAGMLVAGGPAAHELPVDQARANHLAETESLCGDGEPVAEEIDLTVPGPGGGIPVRAYVPRGGAAPYPVIVWLHGGGWMLGSVETYRAPVRRLANASGALVLSVEYRLAPEHPYPAAVQDALAATRWAASEAVAGVGGDPARVAFAGDSAGGNLSAVVARRLRDEVDLRLQALVYPVTDAGVNTPSFRAFEDRFGLTALQMKRFWDVYLDGADGTEPDASPLRDPDLSGVAPAWVMTADHDVLRDEGEAYAAALEDAGVPVELRRWPGTIHGFIRWQRTGQTARDGVDALADALRSALMGAPVRRVRETNLGRQRHGRAG